MLYSDQVNYILTRPFGDPDESKQPRYHSWQLSYSVLVQEVLVLPYYQSAAKTQVTRNLEFTQVLLGV